MPDQSKMINTICMSYSRWLLIVILAIITFPLQAQTNKNKPEIINALKNKLVETSNDSTKVDVYIEIGWALHNSDIDESYEYAQMAEKLALQINYNKGISSAKNLLGIYHGMQGRYRISNILNEKALPYALLSKDSILISKIYNSIAINYSNDSETYEKAYEFYNKALEYNPNDTLRYINTKANIAFLLKDMGQNEKAEKVEKEIVEITNGIKGGPLEIINMEFQVYGFLGKGDTTNAKIILKKLIQKNKNLGNNLSIIYNNLELSDILQSEKKYTEALNIIEEAEEIIIQNGFLDEIDQIILSKATVLSHLGEEAQAIELLNKIDSTTQTYVNALKQLYKLHEKKGDYKSALAYAKKHKILNDSMQNYTSRNIIAELEIMYDTEKKEKENQQLKIESIEIHNELKSRNLLLEYLLAGLGIVIVMLAFFYNQNTQRKKYNKLLSTEVREKTKSLKAVNEDLKETNKELETFTYVAAHDLMTPLRSITSFSGLIKKKNIDKFDKKDIEYFEHIKNSTRWMSTLIEDLLMFTKMSSESYTSVVTNTKALIEEVLAHIQVQIDEKNAIISYKNIIKDIQVDKNKIKQVLQNIIGNAVKYVKPGVIPEVKIIIKETITETIFTISDNGIGIKDNYHEVIFDPFKRLHSKDEYEGTGIGLYICKKIITKSGGTLGLKESATGGTTFFFTIPKEAPQST